MGPKELINKVPVLKSHVCVVSVLYDQVFFLLEAEEDEQRTPLPSTPGDTGSEFSTDFNEVLGSLHSLRRELDDGRSPTEDEGGEDGGGTHVRQRTGHC